MKHWPGDEPDDNDEHSRSKSPCATEHARGNLSKKAERVTDNAEKVALFFVIFTSIQTFSL